jgi:PAS domain S-box-containing protein
MNSDSRSQAELKDTAFFRCLVEHGPGLMCVHDLEGNLLYLNAAAALALGLRPEDGVGWNLRRFLAPSVAHEFDAYLARLRDNAADSGLMRVVAKDGAERLWLYRNVVHQEPGEPPRVLGHAQDVTERILADEALRRAHDELSALVARRTTELDRANAKLRAEIRQRIRIEAETARARRIDDGEAPAAMSARPPAQAAGAPTVLLVERRADVRQFLRYVLQSNGYRVLASADDDEALAVVSECSERVRLVVTDVPAPGSAGSRVADQLAIAHPDTRVLYMCDSPEDVAASRRAGSLAPLLLMKPFTMATLLARVREALAG